MNVVDIVIAVLLIFGFVRGLMKGLFVEVASLVALVGGVYGAIHFSDFIASYLKESVSWSEKRITLAAFALTFIIIVVAVSLAGKMLTKLADFAAMGFLNKLLGGVFGILKFGLILSVLLLFFGRINTAMGFVDKKTIDESILYQPIKNVVPTLFPSILKNEIEPTKGLDTLMGKI